MTPPTLGDVKLPRRRASAAPRASGCSAAISERGTLDAEYYRLDSKGKRVYNGYHDLEHLHRHQPPHASAARWKHFKARPGRYVAVLRATDESNNDSKPVTKGFTILPRG